MSLSEGKLGFRFYGFPSTTQIIPNLWLFVTIGRVHFHQTETHGIAIESGEEKRQKAPGLPPDSPQTFRRIVSRPARIRHRWRNHLWHRQGIARSRQTRHANRHHGRRRKYLSRRAAKGF